MNKWDNLGTIIELTVTVADAAGVPWVRTGYDVCRLGHRLWCGDPQTQQVATLTPDNCMTLGERTLYVADQEGWSWSDGPTISSDWQPSEALLQADSAREILLPNERILASALTVLPVGFHTGLLDNVITLEGLMAEGGSIHDQPNPLRVSVLFKNAAGCYCVGFTSQRVLQGMGMTLATQWQANGRRLHSLQQMKPSALTHWDLAPQIIAKPKMVKIPAGSFQMGSPEEEEGHFDDEKQHLVKVNAFFLAQHTVTVGEFRRFMEISDYKIPKGSYTVNKKWGGYKNPEANWQNPGFAQTDDHPVVCVSWRNAQAYIRWLCDETGLRYRLPTEEEWEYAARAGTKTARYWGEEADKACLYANVADLRTKEAYPEWPGSVHNCRGEYVHTAPVGCLRANEYKLYDMLGNVCEWCSSVYSASYDGLELVGSDDATSGPLRVLRGGAWSDLTWGVRAANRLSDTPNNRVNFSGFRLAQD